MKKLILLLLLCITTYCYAGLSGNYSNRKAITVVEKIKVIPEKIFDEIKISRVDTETFKIEILDKTKTVSVIDAKTIKIKKRTIAETIAETK